MTRLNYSNRKSEGVKLGQIVAKDLRKRIKPNAKADAHRDSALIELNVDGKTLTDTGILELCDGLDDALTHRLTKDIATTRLQVLHLANNQLTAACLPRLSQSIRAGADDLEDLDMSGNNITLATDEHVRHWELFLMAVGECKVLQRLNIAGSDLSNPKAFETFARVGLRQFGIFDKDYLSLENETNGTRQNDEEGLVEDIRTLAVVDQNVPSETLSREKRTTTRRTRLTLLGIRTIILTDTKMTDAGALFLSYTMAKHSWVQSERTFDESSLTSKQAKLGLDAPGIVYLPNSNLEASGLKLLRDAAAVVYDPHPVSPELRENRPAGTPLSMASRKSSMTLPLRKLSDDSGIGHSPDTHSRQSLIIELTSLRKRVQRTILENQGPHGIAMWGAALRFLAYIRTILVDTINFPTLLPFHNSQSSISLSRPQTPTQDKKEEVPPKVSVSPAKDSAWPQLPIPIVAVPPPTYASRLVVTNPTTAATSPSTPQVFRHPRTNRDTNTTAKSSSSSPSSQHRRRQSNHSNSASRPSKSRSPARTFYSSAKQSEASFDHLQMVGPLPLGAWRRILWMLADPDAVLSDGQQEDVFVYARDRRTLGTEREVVGKPDAVQLWRALEGMRCLGYD